MKYLRLALLFGLLGWISPSANAGWGIFQDSTTAASGCSQATNFIARESGTHTNDTALTTFICGLVTDGVYAKFDVFYVFATDQAANAVLNIVSSSFTITNTGATFTTQVGYNGVDGSSTIWLDTGYNPSVNATVYAQNSAHLAVWSATHVQQATGGSSIGQCDGGGCNGAFLFTDAGVTNAIIARINEQNTGGSAASDGNAIGQWVGVRKDGTNTGIVAYKNAVDLGYPTSGTEQASDTVHNDNFFILSLNAGGASNGQGNTISIASIGSALTATDVTNYCHRSNVYLTAVNSTAGGIC